MARQGDKRTVYVYAHWEGINDPVLMGILYSERLRGNEVFSFDSNNTLNRAKTPQGFCQLSCYKTPVLNRLYL